MAWHCMPVRRCMVGMQRIHMHAGTHQLLLGEEPPLLVGAAAKVHDVKDGGDLAARRCPAPEWQSCWVALASRRVDLEYGVTPSEIISMQLGAELCVGGLSVCAALLSTYPLGEATAS
jgi:hypothetical protein